MAEQLNENAKDTQQSGSGIWFAVIALAMCAIYVLSIREVVIQDKVKPTPVIVHDTITKVVYKNNKKKLKELKWELANSRAEAVSWKDECKRLTDELEAEKRWSESYLFELENCKNNLRNIQIENTQYVEQ